MDFLRSLNVSGLTVIALCVVAALAFAGSFRPRRWRGRPRLSAGHRPQVRDANFQRGRDAPDQLRDVIAANFAARRIMSLAEYRMFRAVESELAVIDRGCRVFAQTALGAVLQSPDEPAFRAINAKRVDALVVGPQGLPLIAVEYQGNGHYQNDAAARDAVKREALRKAGVEYLEVFPHTGETDIRRLVRAALDRRGLKPRNASPAPSPQPSPTA